MRTRAYLALAARAAVDPPARGRAALALAIEAAELMEHFQWIDMEASRGVPEQREKLAAVGEELADVVAYSLALANELGLDLSQTIEAKMAKNVLKYPADEFRGRFGKSHPTPSAGGR